MQEKKSRKNMHMNYREAPAKNLPAGNRLERPARRDNIYFSSRCFYDMQILQKISYNSAVASLSRRIGGK